MSPRLNDSLIRPPLNQMALPTPFREVVARVVKLAVLQAERDELLQVHVADTPDEPAVEPGGAALLDAGGVDETVSRQSPALLGPCRATRRDTKEFPARCRLGLAQSRPLSRGSWGRRVASPVPATQHALG